MFVLSSLKDYHRNLYSPAGSNVTASRPHSPPLRASHPRQGSCPWSNICSPGCSGGQCSRAGPQAAWRAPEMRDQSYEEQDKTGV